MNDSGSFVAVYWSLATESDQLVVEPPFGDEGTLTGAVTKYLHKRPLWRAPYTSYALAASVIWSVRAMLAINVCCILWIFANSFTQVGNTTATATVAAFTIANTPTLVLWALIVPRKYRARQSCSIVFLRGFKQEARADVPNRVLPCIGCYGRVLWLRNILKEVAQDWIGAALTDTQYQQIARETWQFKVQKLLQEADLAVIDISVLSDSLTWEITQCLESMPATRIVLIVELSHSAGDNYRQLCNRFPDLLSVPFPIPVYPSRFVIPLNIWRWWFFQFERRVHNCMKQIAAGN